MHTLFKKSILSTRFARQIVLRLFTFVAALALAAMPFTSVSAAGDTLTNAYDPTPPPVERGQISNERLERIWARQLRIYERMGRTDDFMEKAQKLIDRATENGRDVSALQSALDAFKAAARDAQPVYESAKGIINSHQGFDGNGKVTDTEKAKETVQSMRGKLKEIREAMNDTGRALREAIKAYRAANPRPGPTTP